jgi:hypothetical protein
VHLSRWGPSWWGVASREQIRCRRQAVEHRPAGGCRCVHARRLQLRRSQRWTLITSSFQADVHRSACIGWVNWVVNVNHHRIQLIHLMPPHCTAPVTELAGCPRRRPEVSDTSRSQVTHRTTCTSRKRHCRSLRAVACPVPDQREMLLPADPRTFL